MCSISSLVNFENDERYVAGMVKSLPAMQEMPIQSLGLEDPPGKGTATHFDILSWRIPWTEEPGGLQSMGSQDPESRTGLNH